VTFDIGLNGTIVVTQLRSDLETKGAEKNQESESHLLDEAECARVLGVCEDLGLWGEWARITIK
jgi:hypothetical protein